MKSVWYQRRSYTCILVNLCTCKRPFWLFTFDVYPYLMVVPSFFSTIKYQIKLNVHECILYKLVNLYTYHRPSIIRMACIPIPARCGCGPIEGQNHINRANVSAYHINWLICTSVGVHWVSQSKLYQSVLAVDPVFLKGNTIWSQHGRSAHRVNWPGYTRVDRHPMNIPIWFIPYLFAL